MTDVTPDPAPAPPLIEPVTRRALIAGAGAATIVAAGQGVAQAVQRAPDPLPTTPVLPTRMRGLNLELSPGSLSPAIARELASWGINVVRINFSTDIASHMTTDKTVVKPTRNNPLAPYRLGLAMLKQFTAECARLGVSVILAASGVFGRDKVNLEDSTGASFRTELGSNLMQFWSAMARALRNDPAIIAYDILNEPNYSLRRDVDGAVWYEQLMPEAIRQIRAVNPHIWIAVMPWPWGFADRYGTMPLIDDPAILYSFHSYAPHNFTHQGIGKIARGTRYPGRIREYETSPLQQWDRTALANSMQPAFDFVRRHKVRMMCSEFGAVRWAEGRERWLTDMLSILEDNGVDWLFHTYNTWNGWNPSFAANAREVGVHPTLYGGVNSPSHQLLRRQWRKNVTL